MACPSAAGAAALIFQYFHDRSFWASLCNPQYPSCHAFLPSGVLMKAILLHSGEGMSKYTGGPQGDINLKSPPDNYQVIISYHNIYIIHLIESSILFYVIL